MEKETEMIFILIWMLLGLVAWIIGIYFNKKLLISDLCIVPITLILGGLAFLFILGFEVLDKYGDKVLWRRKEK